MIDTNLSDHDLQTMLLNGEIEVTETLRIQYLLEDNESVWDLDIPDYDLEATDEFFRAQATAILAQDVFAPYGMACIAIKQILKIKVVKEQIAHD